MSMKRRDATASVPVPEQTRVRSADRLENAFEEPQIYAGFLLTREETIRAISLSGRSKP